MGTTLGIFVGADVGADDGVGAVVGTEVHCCTLQARVSLLPGQPFSPLVDRERVLVPFPHGFEHALQKLHCPTDLHRHSLMLHFRSSGFGHSLPPTGNRFTIGKRCWIPLPQACVHLPHLPHLNEQSMTVGARVGAMVQSCSLHGCTSFV